MGSCSGFRNCKWIPQIYADSAYNLHIPVTICGICLQFADSTYKLRISLLVSDSARAKYTKHIYYHLIMDSTNGSGFHKFCCGFRKLPVFEAIYSNTVF